MKYHADLLTVDKIRLEVNNLELITDGDFTFTEQNYKEFILQKNCPYTFVGDEEILCINSEDIIYVSITKAE